MDHGLWFTYTKLLFIDNCNGRPYQYARITIGVKQSVFTNVRESQIVEQLVRVHQFSGLNTPDLYGPLKLKVDFVAKLFCD